MLGFVFDDDRGDFNTPIFSEVRRTTVHSGGLEIVQELTSALRLTAQTGFSRSDTERPSVNAGTPGETNILTGDFLQHLFTQEFRLNYVGERLDATVGIYGAWEDENAGFRRPDFFGFASDVSKTDRDEWNLACFGEVSYALLPSWKAVLGGRVDHTDQEGSSFFSRNGTARTDFSYALSDTVVLPKVGFLKEIGPHHTIGFTFQRGFRTGGAGVQRSTGRVFDFDSEYAWNYELSYTGRVFDNRLALSANVFYLDLEDQQIETLADPLDPALAFTDNAAESHAVGFELEGRGRLPFGLSGFFSVGFVDTEFDTFNLAGRDLSGEAFPEAPRWNVAAGAFYQHASGVFLGVDFEYTDDFRARIAQPPTDTLDDFFLTNVQTGYRSSWFILKLFIDNVADRPAGALSANARDMGRLALFLATDGRSVANPPVSPAGLRRLRRGETSLAGRHGYRYAYGLGMFGFVVGTRVWWGHWGKTEGFLANLGVLPEHGLGFVLLSNTSSRRVGSDLPPASPPRPAIVTPRAAFSGTYLPFTHDMALRSWLFALLGAVVVERGDTALQVRPLLPTGATTALIPMTARFHRTPTSPVATHLFLEDEGRTVLFGEYQDTFRRLAPAEALGLRVGLAVGVCVVVLSVLAALAVGVGRLFGRAWARPAAPLLSFGAAGISLCALLAGFFVLGVTAPLDRLLLLGRPGPHALALLLGSLLWPSFAVLGSLHLARGWRVCPRYVRAGGLLAAAVYLLIAGVLAWLCWLPLLTWRA